MENKKYVVCRDEIYVGEVVRTDSIYRYEGDDDFFRTKPGQLSPCSWRSYRSMLFVPNEDKLSNDLLYRSPNYPILNVTDDNACLNLGENSIVINDACNLAALLEYFGYKKDLTYEDIMEIRRTFFTGRFGMDNSKLFGMEEFIPSHFMPNITDHDKRYELYKKSLSLGSERQFGSISTNELPRELMAVLDERGNKSLMDVINGFDEKIDTFTPHKEESLVKRLKRL